MSTYLETIGSLHPDLIDEFLRTGVSSVIPIDLQHIIQQMVFSVQIYQGERNISRAAKILQTRALVTQGVNLTIQTAKSRIYAALNYFDVESNVQKPVWLRDYANKFEDMARVALAAGRFDISERCMTKAMQCRLDATTADKQTTLGVAYLISDKVSPEDLGFTTVSKKEIAKKASDGVYSKIIDGLKITEKQKKLLREDAELVEYEEIPDE